MFINLFFWIFANYLISSNNLVLRSDWMIEIRSAEWSVTHMKSLSTTRTHYSHHSRNRRFWRTNQKTAIRNPSLKNKHFQHTRPKKQQSMTIRFSSSCSRLAFHFYLRLIRILIKINDSVFQIAAYPDLVQQYRISSQFINIFPYYRRVHDRDISRLQNLHG